MTHLPPWLRSRWDWIQHSARRCTDRHRYDTRHTSKWSKDNKNLKIKKKKCVSAYTCRAAISWFFWIVPIFWGLPIFSAHTWILNSLEPITQKELKASRLSTDDSLPGPQARLWSWSRECSFCRINPDRNTGTQSLNSLTGEVAALKVSQGHTDAHTNLCRMGIDLYGGQPNPPPKQDYFLLFSILGSVSSSPEDRGN